MVVLIDPPAWPAHGRLWSHLASDVSYEELHAFALAAGVPLRAFEGDHYDVPQERYAQLVAAGARPVASRDLLRALQLAGLRLPKLRGERVLHSWPEGHLLPDVGPHQVDVVLSPHGPPTASTSSTWGLSLRAGLLAVVEDDLPLVAPDAGSPLGFLRARSRLDSRRWHLALRRVEADHVLTPAARWRAAEQLRGSRVAAYWWPLIDRELARAAD